MKISSSPASGNSRGTGCGVKAVHITRFMNRSICIFLSVMLLFCSAFSAAFAASLEETGGKRDQKKQDGDRSSYGGSGTDEVSKSDDGYGTMEDDNPKNGLRIGDATSIITKVQLSKSRLDVTVQFRNDGGEAASWSSIFWLSVYQNKKLIQRDNHSVGILGSRMTLNRGESKIFILSFDLPDPNLPAELQLEPFSESDNRSVSLWFDPQSKRFGTWEELGLTEARVTKAEATPVPIVQSRRAGWSDGSIGGLPAPKAERLPHTMRAYLTFKNGAGKYVDDGTQELLMNESGQYTLTLESGRAVQGISFLSVSVNNPQSFDKADDSGINGRSIRIDEIQVNGKPVSFGKAPTVLKLTFKANTDTVVNRYISCTLCFADREFDSVANAGYYFWDGDSGTQLTLNVVDPADFASFQSISVTFSYGYFD